MAEYIEETQDKKKSNPGYLKDENGNFKERVVLTDDKILAFKRNSSSLSPHMMRVYPSRQEFLKTIVGKEFVTLKFDVLGLDYWEIFVLGDNEWIQANSYFFDSEFDRCSEKLLKGKTFKEMVMLLLLNGLPMLLKEGIKTYFFCQLEPIELDKYDFRVTYIPKDEIAIETITPAKHILLKEAPEGFISDMVAFHTTFMSVELAMRAENVPGLRIMKLDEVIDEMEKKLKEQDKEG